MHGPMADVIKLTRSRSLSHFYNSSDTFYNSSDTGLRVTRASTT
jgi:hypothetical protein